LGDLENIFLLAESLGAYRHLFHNVRFAGRAFVNRQSLALDRQMLLQAQERVVALRNLHRLQVQPPYLPVDNYARRLRGEYQGKVFGCGGLSFKCGVKSDGTVVPCLLFTAAFSLGRVSPDRRLADIWNQDQAVRLHQTLHGEPHPGCQHCDHLTWCGGGCRYAAWTQGGDLSGQDQSCPDVR
jgi:radical SAM protein with 4Fe4S-binding SPASM domain